MSDLTDAIEADAEKALSTSNDGVSVTRRSAADQIAAANYAAAKAATADMASTVKNMFSVFVPPGGH